MMTGDPSDHSAESARASGRAAGSGQSLRLTHGWPRSSRSSEPSTRGRAGGAGHGRSCWPSWSGSTGPSTRTPTSTHVTASAIVVGPRGVVLHRHRRLHRWMQPGGHLEAGEMPRRPRCASASRRPDCRWPTRRPGRSLVHVDVHTAAARATSIWTCATWCGRRTWTRARPGGEPGRGLVHLGGRPRHRRRRPGRGPAVGP